MENNNGASAFLNIRITKELKTRLTRAAKKRGMKTSDAHRLAIVEYCERIESKSTQSELFNHQ